MNNYTPRAIAVRVQKNVSQYVDEHAGPTVCGAGCSHCCKLPVGLSSLAELRLMVDAFKKQATKKEFRAFNRKIREDFDATREIRNPGEYIKAGITCPFLKDNKCSVYDVRPAVCRAMYSTDETFCKKGLALAIEGKVGDDTIDRTIGNEAMQFTYEVWKEFEVVDGCFLMQTGLGLLLAKCVPDKLILDLFHTSMADESRKLRRVENEGAA